MPESISASLRDNFSLSTWLAAAALGQSFLLALFPIRLAIVPSVALIVIRLIHGLLVWNGLVQNELLVSVRFGRWTSKIPSRDGQVAAKPSDKRVTVLILGARNHDPAGPFAPDLLEIASTTNKLFEELEQDPKRFGFLGRTPALVSTEVSSSNTIVWLIYWESLEALHHWANSESHSNAMRMYQTKSQKNSNYPLAVMHETYDVPAGHWETIYLNFRPFGLGACTFPVDSNDEKSAKQDDGVNGLYPAKGKNWKTMLGRMGREDLDQVVGGKF